VHALYPLQAPTLPLLSRARSCRAASPRCTATCRRRACVTTFASAAGSIPRIGEERKPIQSRMVTSRGRSVNSCWACWWAGRLGAARADVRGRRVHWNLHERNEEEEGSHYTARGACARARDCFCCVVFVYLVVTARAGCSSCHGRMDA